MLDRNFLVSFLRVNNASPEMSDAELRQVLSAAGWTMPEIAESLEVLRMDAQTAASKTVKRFRTDMEFSSAELSQLLGVDVVIDPDRVRGQAGGSAIQKKDVGRNILVSLVATLAVLCVVFGMGIVSAYYLDLDPFALQ